MQPKRNNKSLGHRLFKAITVIIGALILVFAAYAAYVFMSYHRIEDKQELTVINKNEGTTDDATNSTAAGTANGTNNTAGAAKTNTEYSIVTYNVGFGAYTPDFSFFMDGGKSSWAKSKDSVIETIGECIKTLQDIDPDISLIEEIDLNATRSYHVPELDYFARDLAYENYVFAVNYDSAFLFYPLTQPHGKTLAGIGTFSKFPITSAVRRSFPRSHLLCAAAFQSPRAFGKSWIWTDVILLQGFRSKTDGSLWSMPSTCQPTAIPLRCARARR